MGDEIGGHHVSGHIHTTAEIRQIEDTENNKRLTFMVSKGDADALQVIDSRCVQACFSVTSQAVISGYSACCYAVLV